MGKDSKSFHSDAVDKSNVTFTPTVDGVYKLNLCYQFEDNQPVPLVPYIVTDTAGKVLQKGQLDDKGLACITGLPAGDYEIQYGETEDEKKLSAVKKELKKYFDDIIGELKEKARKREEELKKMPWYKRGWIYTLAFVESVYNAGKEIVELAIDVVTSVVEAKIEVFKIIIGPGSVEDKINKMKGKLEDLMEYGEEAYKTMEEFYDTYQLLSEDTRDPKAMDMLQDFAVDYAKNLTTEDYVSIAGGTVFTIIVALLTAGAGAAAAVATKIPKLMQAAEKIKEIVSLLKKIKFNKKVKANHKSPDVKTTVPADKKKKVEKKEKKKCKRRGCKKGYSQFCPYSEPVRARANEGNNEGDSIALRDNMWGKDPGQKDHPWWTGSRSLQAHHLIPSESMKKWKKLCDNFGYDINSKLNGVMLPNQLDLACHLGVPLHRGNHSKTYPKYPIAASKLIQVIQRNVNKGKYCGRNGYQKFEEDMNKISSRICRKVSSFAWKLTEDGDDYSPDQKRGCGDRTSVGTKQRDCSKNRKHEFVHEKTKKKIPSYKETKRWTLKTNDRHLR